LKNKFTFQRWNGETRHCADCNGALSFRASVGIVAMRILPPQPGVGEHRCAGRLIGVHGLGELCEIG